MKPLLVIGSVNADLYVEVARLPQPGETLPGVNAAIRSGGKGANQAAAAARLGRTTHFAGRIGTDPFAASLRQDLSAASVDLSLLQTVPGPTGQAWILLQAGGNNSIVLVAGANHAWGALDAALESAVREAGAVLLQREIPEAINLQVAQWAVAAGVPVVLDAGGVTTPVPRDLLACVSVLSPNELELAQLTGLPITDEHQVLAAARHLQQQGVRSVLVKLGARGSLLVESGDVVLRQRAYAVQVVDTTGAGDCFTAAYTVGLLEGLDAGKRLRLASAAAGLCVQSKGAMPSMPGRPAVERFLAMRAETVHG